MATPKAAHHRGTHQVRARRVVTAANLNPDTRCARCGLTLPQHPHTKTGKPPRWQAGHAIDGQINGTLRPEADVCNTSAGARLRNERNAHEPHTEHW